ncbi:MAG: hypothetical protein LIO68_05635 [Rikenellaceae bacterium]|nr:hypothetical protein [Rikenellaceae bacterium]
MKHMFTILFFAASVSLTGCNNTLRHARQVADASGNPEMNQVINHYKDDPEKLEAAVFLIENMPRHRTQTFELVDTQGQLSGVSLYRPEITSANYRQFLDLLGLHVRHRTIPDTAAMTAGYLIRNIDRGSSLFSLRPPSRPKWTALSAMRFQRFRDRMRKYAVYSHGVIASRFF